MRRLKLLIADDHRLMLDAVQTALQEAEDEFEVVATTSRGSQVLPLVAQTQPDVVLLDLRMPEMDGLTCLGLLQQRHPQVKAIVLSGVDDPAVARAAFERGAAAFILKHIDPRDLVSAVRQAVEGTVYQTFGAPTAAAEEQPSGEKLSERELAILKALADGLSNKEISKQLWLAEQTVKFHLTNVYRKLGVRTRTEAARAAYQRGILGNPLLERTESLR